MDADSLLASVPTTEQVAVRTSWRVLKVRIVDEARVVPVDREDLREGREDWLKRWSALWVELQALCLLGEHVGQPLTPFEDFDAAEITAISEALHLQKKWSVPPVKRPIVVEEVSIATLPVAPAAESSEYDGKGTGNKASEDSAGEGIDQLGPRETRSSAKKRMLVKAASLPSGVVVHKPPCEGCSRAVMEKVCEGWCGEKCFPCCKGPKVCSLTAPPPSASPAPTRPPPSSASTHPIRSSSKSKGVTKASAGGSLFARRGRQLQSSEEMLKKMASSLFNQAEELRLLREAEFGSS